MLATGNMSLARRIVDVCLALFTYFSCLIILFWIAESISQNSILLQRFANLAAWIAAIFFLVKRYPLEEKIFHIDNDQVQLLVKYGLLGGFLVAILSYPYVYIHKNGSILQNSFVDPKYGVASVIVFLFFSVLVSPTLEEMFTRACLFRILKEKIGFLDFQGT